MGFRYRKHYTLIEARGLLPQIRKWIQELQELQRSLTELTQQITVLLGPGEDLGGECVNNWVKTCCKSQQLLREFRSREIEIKDIDRGLVDFPALRGGHEIFLCWEQDEEDIEFWHELDAGYAGRERL